MPRRKPSRANRRERLAWRVAARGCSRGARAMWATSGLRRQVPTDAAASQPREAGTPALPLLPGDGAQPSPGPFVKRTQHRWGARGFAASSIWPWLSRLVQPPRAVMAAVDHHGRGILHRDIGGCVGASRQARHLQHRPGFAVHWGRPSLACLPATALRSRKHSSIRPCCPSRPQRTWDLHQTLLG